MQPAVEAAVPEGEGRLPQEVRPGEPCQEPALEGEDFQPWGLEACDLTRGPSLHTWWRCCSRCSFRPVKAAPGLVLHIHLQRETGPCAGSGWLAEGPLFVPERGRVSSEAAPRLTLTPLPSPEKERLRGGTAPFPRGECFSAEGRGQRAGPGGGRARPLGPLEADWGPDV